MAKEMSIVSISGSFSSSNKDYILAIALRNMTCCIEANHDSNLKLAWCPLNGRMVFCRDLRRTNDICSLAHSYDTESAAEGEFEDRIRRDM